MGLISRRGIQLTLALALYPAAAGAQRALVREVFVGSRVRVFAPTLRSDRYVGRIDSLDASAMVIDTTGARRRLGFDTGPVLVEDYRRVKIQLASVDHIEVSGGRTTRGSTIRGAVVGGLIGGAVWGLGNLPETNPSASDFVKEAPAGIVVGVLIGGIVGYALGGERWLPAQLPR